MQEYDVEFLNQLLIILIPIIVIELILLAVALYDWVKQGSELDSRYVWLLVILFLNMIGPIIYFLVAPRQSKDELYLEEEETQKT